MLAVSVAHIKSNHRNIRKRSDEILVYLAIDLQPYVHTYCYIASCGLVCKQQTADNALAFLSLSGFFVLSFAQKIYRLNLLSDQRSRRRRRRSLLSDPDDDTATKKVKKGT